jgi:hypothetical protein
VTLAAARAAADEADRLFPLSLASRAAARSAQSFHQCRRHGGPRLRQCARALPRLEVVLPTGEVWDGLRRLRKDNPLRSPRPLHRRRGRSA